MSKIHGEEGLRQKCKDEAMSFLDELRILFRFKADNKMEVIGKTDLNTRIIKRKTTRIFKEFKYLQRAIYNNKANMNIFKIKFCFSNHRYIIKFYDESARKNNLWGREN